ncbi:interleukin-12 receptor subunit beta-2 [Brachyistius frenatus]|uniref:interleukin-12 receptor subunit beta-2 n=1 Tax=Brachyistius frenatus TaxID=100188 RepID=UPI0037E83C0A
MAIMFLAWSVFLSFTVLVVQPCNGEKSCVIWSSAGPVVQRGSTFKVYCTFNWQCKKSMRSGHPPTPQSHNKFNYTTIYFNVVNITKNRTYSCHCNSLPAPDPCGLDISAGYLPDHPKNLKCIYKIKNTERGLMVCTWSRGRDTYLRNSSMLWVRTVSGNHTDGPESNIVSSKGTEVLSVSFDVSRSVQLISVWVEAQNPLGSVNSSLTNYTLCDIVMPPAPVLVQPKCSSRECIIKVEQSMRMQHLQIQYRDEQQPWTNCPDSVAQTNSSRVRSISSLEPYRLYHFRARSKFSTGLWSQWSTNISSWTEEEAPAKELDIWFTDPASDSRSMRVYWKEANISISRGKIIEYKVSVYSPNLTFKPDVINISADTRSYSVPSCTGCEVTVWARNSKGLSPPARITTRRTKAEPPQDVRVTLGNYNITISWRKAKAAPLPSAYILEWYPESHKVEELRWVRLGKNDYHTIITGIQPYECYEGAVYALYNDSGLSRTRFKGVATLWSAPAAGPSVQETVEGNKVKITWSDLPRDQRMGCITKYTIYLENSNRYLQHYSTPASERTYVIKDLPSGDYSLWMTATTGNESRAGQKVKFFLKQETQLFLLLMCVVTSLFALLLLCLCQSSTVKQRFWEFFQCLMLDVVPDPANSKWAKECTQEKGKLNLQLQLSDSSVTEEEEPILVDVEELPRQNSDTSTNVSSQLPLQTSLSPDTVPATRLYPLTTYIKSFSHDSDSSDHTLTSLDTNTTVGYISSPGLGNMEEVDQEEEEESEDMYFFSSPNTFIEPMKFGGKLTLDAVKIDCSGFSQNA